MPELKSYRAWDIHVRWFHWINLLCMLGLIAVGVAILNDKALGVTNDGKVLLKTVHVWIGYVFALNLLWRLIWAFIGGPSARWRAILPGGRGYLGELRRFAADAGSQPRQYLGHTPPGRIAITVLLLLMTTQAVSGLVLAGTDVFYPPLGAWIAGWVAAPGVDPAILVPYAPELYDEAAFTAMRAFRGPFITVHYWGFYALLAFVVLHVAAVIATELRAGGALISAMFTGEKLLRERPADRPEA